jgi:hypothetical protein
MSSFEVFGHQAGFGPGGIAVTRRVIGCYCASARKERSARPSHPGRKDAERRDKAGLPPGSHAGPGMACQYFQNAGDVTNGAAGL